MTMSARSPTPERWAFDPRWCLVANRWTARRNLHLLFGTVSRLADGWIWYGMMLGLATCAGMRGVYAAAQMLCTGLVAWLLYRGLKQRTRRLRPFNTHPGVIARAPPLDEYSFPSGHTLHAVSFSIVAIAWFPSLAAPLAGFTLLVAISRVALGLHYPTDVLAGIALGTTLAGASLWAGSLLRGLLG
jgi:undecaprenyl-diphosphatase